MHFSSAISALMFQKPIKNFDSHFSFVHLSYAPCWFIGSWIWVNNDGVMEWIDLGVCFRRSVQTVVQFRRKRALRFSTDYLCVSGSERWDSRWYLLVIATFRWRRYVSKFNLWWLYCCFYFGHLCRVLCMMNSRFNCVFCKEQFFMSYASFVATEETNFLE